MREREREIEKACWQLPKSNMKSGIELLHSVKYQQFRSGKLGYFSVGPIMVVEGKQGGRENGRVCECKREGAAQQSVVVEDCFLVAGLCITSIQGLRCYKHSYYDFYNSAKAGNLREHSEFQII